MPTISGSKFSKEHKEKIRNSRLEKKHLKETKLKISKSLKGHSFSRETLKKIGDAERGEKHWNWKNGISKQRDYRSTMEEQRRTRIMGNGGLHTMGEWKLLIIQYNFTCPSCKKSEPEIKLTQDHIIPLTKGGSNNIENIQPLCRNCNSKKYTKIIKYEFN